MSAPAPEDVPGAGGADEEAQSTIDNGLVATIIVVAVVVIGSCLLFPLLLRWDPRYFAPVAKHRKGGRRNLNPGGDSYFHTMRKFGFGVRHKPVRTSLYGQASNRSSPVGSGEEQLGLRENAADSDDGQVVEHHRLGLYHFVRPELPRRWFGFEWILATWNFTEDELKERPSGIDYVLYLRYLKYSAAAFFIMTFFGLTVLLPVNLSGTNKDLDPEAPEHVEGSARYTLSNIEQGSYVMIIHLIFVFFFSCLAMAVPVQLFRDWGELLQEDKIKSGLIDVTLRTPNNPKDKAVVVAHHTARNLLARTVMVFNLQRSLSSQDLLNMFRQFYGDRVLFAYKVPDIKKLASRHSDLLYHLERLRNAREYERIHNEKLIITVPKNPKATRATGFSVALFGFLCRCCICCGVVRMPAEDFHGSRASALMTKVVEGQMKLVQADAIHYDADGNVCTTEESQKSVKYSRVGFVVFNSVALAQASAQVIHSSAHTYEVRPAPTNPQNINWDRVTLRNSSRIVRKLLVTVALAALFFFWTIPVTAIAAVSNLETLQETDGLEWLADIVSSSDFVRTIVSGFLPGLALLIFMALLPKILRGIIGYVGFWTMREFANAVGKTYFLFLYLNVFIVFTLTGSLFSVIDQIVDSPSDTVELLAKALPTQAIFFAKYVLLQSAGFSIFFHLRLMDYAIAKIKALTVHTHSDHVNTDAPSPTNWEWEIHIARTLLVFTLGLTYAVISPIILPFVFFYFGLTYWVAKYNFAFVLVPEWTNVRIIRMTANYILIATVTAQIAVIGMFSVAEFVLAPVVLIAVAGVFAVRFWINRRYGRATKHVPLDTCPDAVLDPARVDWSTFPLAHPAMVPPEADDVDDNDMLGSFFSERADDRATPGNAGTTGSGDRSPTYDDDHLSEAISRRREEEQMLRRSTAIGGVLAPEAAEAAGYTSPFPSHDSPGSGPRRTMSMEEQLQGCFIDGGQDTGSDVNDG